MEFVDAFSGISVSDLAEARAFYDDVLGLPTHDAMGGFGIELPGGSQVYVYEKGEAHTPATFTVLNLVVTDIDASVDAFEEAGGHLEHYDMPSQDERGIARPDGPEWGPTIAWFLDPSGNVISFIQSSE